MTPRLFLLLGGIILVALGTSGLFILGPTAGSSVLRDFFWFDSFENIAHLLFGVVALAAYYLLKDAQVIRGLVILVGIAALAAAVLGFMNSGVAIPNVGVTNLENPSDNILHLVVAAWAFYVSFMGKRQTAA